ncbi:hypothetical protein VPH35_024832 [Triticum aestivum]|uniref:Uncharacterized protein n=1 Tax=Triticum turgidum subsp. durum TaxID=4567 RepID=A0A9R1P9E7_TRITD|nr:unnamed protein product [Triticum turgidum subsp. durum]
MGWLAVVVGLLVAWPLFVGGHGEAVTDAIAELLGPVGQLLLPVGLLLSSDHGPGVFVFGGSPDTVLHVGGSPIGMVVMLILILALLYYRSVLFGGGRDDDE